MITQKFIKDKRGITLVELIVAIALTVIILAASTSFVVPLYRYYGKAILESKGIKVSGAIEGRLKEILSSSIIMYVTTTDPITVSGTDFYYISVVSNRIEYKLDNTIIKFLNDSEYEGLDVDLVINTKYKGSDTLRYTIIQFNIILSRNEQVIVERIASVNLYNMDIDISRKIYILNTTDNPDEITDYKCIKFQLFS